MQEIDITLIKERSIKGIVALTSRTFLLQIIAFSATFLLTIFLTPQIFGVFYVVSAIIAFLGYFSDIGLAAALIQKKEALTQEDLSTTFTIQQALVGSAVVIALVCSDAIGRFYGLDRTGVWLFRALVVSFFLSSLKTIPSVLLERTLEFNKLVIPNILETVAFYAVAVFLAWKGYGIQSFTWAVIARAVVGLGAMYVVSPWRMTLGISRKVAKKLLKFGLPFQLNSFLALLKDDLLTVFLGKILPFAEIGYIGWAKKWAEVPLRLIMDSVIRVTFPAFSRLQESKVLLGRAIEKALFGVVFAMMPISIGLMFFIQPLISVIPKYGKWEPAVLSFYFFALVSLIASISTPLTNALNAVGKIKITLMLMVMWTILTWIMVMICIHLFGFTGVSVALFLVSLTVGVVVFLAKKIASFSLLLCTVKPIIGGLVQTGWYILLLQCVGHTMVGFILAAASGVILYVAVLWLIDRNRINELIVSFRR
jgi:O-antigen/teichoic acid export membrane protein